LRSSKPLSNSDFRLRTQTAAFCSTRSVI